MRHRIKNGVKLMNRIFGASVLVSVVLMCSACSRTKPLPPEPKAPAPQTATTEVQPGELRIGEASGSYTAKGEVVELKYAYAGKGQRFGQESMVILVTDKPVPPDAVAEEIKSQKLLLAETIRGLEYVIDENGMWVRYHPGQYQESTSKQLKEYSVNGDVVRGVDENDGNLSDGRYARSVKFVAAVVK
jgi:hypothetical protein